MAKNQKIRYGKGCKEYIAMLAFLTAIAGIAMSASYFLQAYRIIRRGSADDVSVSMFVIMLVGTALWTAYGISQRDAVIISGFALGVLGTTTVLLLTHYYRSRPHLKTA